MKEFDYTKWDNKPREMWVWDNDESNKEKRFVTFVCPNHILALTDGAVDCMWWKHCAEIEPTRRMTNYELAHWLWKGTQVGEFRELGIVNENNYNIDSYSIYHIHSYSSKVENDIVGDFYKIRVNGGEWKEPLIEE